MIMVNIIVIICFLVLFDGMGMCCEKKTMIG